VIKPDGTFEIANVPPGAYTLKSPNGSLRIDVGPTKLNGLTIPEAPIFDLKGRFAWRAPIRQRRRAEAGAGARRRKRGAGCGESDGSFVFRNVTNVSYRVKLAIRQSFYLAGAKSAAKMLWIRPSI
jgi:hypothetical protein